MQLTHEIKIFDELAKKRLKIVYYEVESNKDWNTDLSELIQKNIKSRRNLS